MASYSSCPPPSPSNHPVSTPPQTPLSFPRSLTPTPSYFTSKEVEALVTGVQSLDPSVFNETDNIFQGLFVCPSTCTSYDRMKLHLACEKIGLFTLSIDAPGGGGIRVLLISRTNEFPGYETPSADAGEVAKARLARLYGGDLNKRIIDMKRREDGGNLLKLVSSSFNSLNGINVSTCWVACASMSNKSVDRIVNDSRLEKFKADTVLMMKADGNKEDNTDLMNIRCYANILHSFAKLGVTLDSAQVVDLSCVVERKGSWLVEGGTPQEVSGNIKFLGIQLAHSLGSNRGHLDLGNHDFD